MNLRLDPDTLARPNGFVHVVRSTGRDTVLVSGQVAYDANGTIVGRGDLALQTRQVYGNLAKALAAVGATLDDLVKTTLFVRDLDPEKARIVRAARAPFMAPDRLPASTMVGVSSLAHPDLMLEVEAIAMVAPAQPL
ncbi:RidA family protein [Zeimonas arvi]|uniref:RidA family protein n=1 Tax=Zeimonas arvi TaxID=2498847 RepID=A0A5C8P161_9BURK|nr:RidA family protein [Zeimonas arvi]TXL66987.1 RidA family protein [Zeimonas arvi]